MAAREHAHSLRHEGRGPLSHEGPGANRVQSLESTALSLQRSVGNGAVSSLLSQMLPAVQRQAASKSSSKKPGGGSTPEFEHNASTVTINADSAVDFADQIRTRLGGAHCAIVIEPDVKEEWSTYPDGREVPGTRVVVSVGIKVTTTIHTVRFGMGRPDAKNKAKITEMVALMKAHEEAHRSYIVTAATDALKKAQTYVGKRNKGAAALKVLNGAECVANKQHETLDAKEGVFTVTDNAGEITIAKSSSGAKYPCGKK
jgi:hypothetical protein